MRIVVLGGGFGGVAAVRHLERVLRRRTNVEITLVSRENCFVLTPLLFTGFVAWWMRRTYYLFQMPRWDRRLRIVLDWTVALCFRPDITRVDLRVEREQVKQARQLVERSSETVRAMQT
jgi:NADH dehydrogenase FAD-containing subunit